MKKTRIKGFLGISVLYLVVCLFYSNCAMREEPTATGSLTTLGK
ncbi:hypothetical protein [Bdellovibrio sp. NC01]|nr:hypothetical protein [Bdellovibrio sp. NC01]